MSDVSLLALSSQNLMENEPPTTLGDLMATLGWLVLVVVVTIALIMARRAMPSWIARRVQEVSYFIRLSTGITIFICLATVVWIMLFMNHETEWWESGGRSTMLIIGASFLSFYGAFSLVVTILEPLNLL